MDAGVDATSDAGSDALDDSDAGPGDTGAETSSKDGAAQPRCACNATGSGPAPGSAPLLLVGLLALRLVGRRKRGESTAKSRRKAVLAAMIAIFAGSACGGGGERCVIAL